MRQKVTVHSRRHCNIWKKSAYILCLKENQPKNEKVFHIFLPIKLKDRLQFNKVQESFIKLKEETYTGAYHATWIAQGQKLQKKLQKKKKRAMYKYYSINLAPGRRLKRRFTRNSWSKKPISNYHTSAKENQDQQSSVQGFVLLKQRFHPGAILYLWWVLKFICRKSFISYLAIRKKAYFSMPTYQGVECKSTTCSIIMTLQKSLFHFSIQI